MRRMFLILLVVFMIVGVGVLPASSATCIGTEPGTVEVCPDAIRDQIHETFEPFDRAGGRIICENTGSCQEYTYPSLEHFVLCTIDESSC